jgi:RhtB (resistance to homoserine/threonine) family protein
MSIEFFSAPYWVTLINLVVLNFVALVSPGPDFAIVVKNSLVHSKKAGMMTALGIAAGETAHLSYILLGVGVVIAKNLWLLNMVKLLGIIYLSYLGIKMLRAKKVSSVSNIAFTHSSISLKSAFQNGLFANLLNPKAILFFIGVFTIVVDLNTPMSVLLIYAVAMVLTTLLWFSIVAQLFSARKIREKFLGISHWVERITGGLLIAISIKLALTKEY